MTSPAINAICDTCRSNPGQSNLRGADAIDRKIPSSCPPRTPIAAPSWAWRPSLFLALCLSLAPLLPVRSVAITVEKQVRNLVKTAEKDLDDPDLGRQLTAVRDLALLAAETWDERSFHDAVEALLEAVRADEPDTAKLASEELETLSQRRDLPSWAGSILEGQLRQATDHRDIPLSLLASSCLLHVDPLDPVAVTEILDRFVHKRSEVRSLAVEALVSLWRTQTVPFTGPFHQRLLTLLTSDSDGIRFAAARALWALAQLTGDQATLTLAEKGFTDVLIRTRSVDMSDRLDRLVLTVGIPPSLPPGLLLPATLRRIVEEQPPESALRAAIARMLLSPSRHDSEPSRLLQKILPGLLKHSYPAIRVKTAELIGRYGMSRLFPAHSSHDSPLASMPTLNPSLRELDPSVRTALTNLFNLPPSAPKLQALGQTTVVPGFLTDHASDFANTLFTALISTNLRTVSSALEPSLIGAYALPESAPALELVPLGLTHWNGETTMTAVELMSHPAAPDFNQTELGRAIPTLLSGASPSHRRAAGLMLLLGTQQLGNAQAVLNNLPQNSAPQLFRTLAQDPHPSVAWLGVAGLVTEALNANLEPRESSAPGDLAALLDTDDPSVRCRLVAMVRGLNPYADQAPHSPYSPASNLSPQDLALTLEWLNLVEQHPDPLLLNQVQAARRQLESTADVHRHD